MKTHIYIVFVCLFAWCAMDVRADISPPMLDLSGEWRAVLREDISSFDWSGAEGVRTIHLPGSIQAQGMGQEVSDKTVWVGKIANRDWFDSPVYAKYRQPGHVMVPYWLQPEKRYIGSAWFRREIKIPASWAGKHIRLMLERVHVNANVWVDGKSFDSDNVLVKPLVVNPNDRTDPNDNWGDERLRLGNASPGSLSTPHVIDLGHLTSGSHVIELRVDNTPPAYIGPNSHGVTDHSQTSWNGVVGKIELMATPDTWLNGIEVFPDVQGKKIRVDWRVGGQPAAGSISLVVRAPDGKKFQTSADVKAGQTVVNLGPEIRTWDEFSPELYDIVATLTLPDGATHQVSSTFGMVDYKVVGKHFLVNGRRTIFRGTLDCAFFPLTGYPSTDVAYWKKVIRAVKKHGFNHIRFHSWCPPKAAFVAADELGCYLQVEHAWTNPDKAGPYLMAEAERVIREYGNHPSFAMHAYGNEPVEGQQWLENFSAHFRKRDPRRYYTGAAGREPYDNSQFALPQGDDIRLYTGKSSPINSQPPSTLPDFGKKTASLNMPLLCHEPGQWCVYPDFTEISKYKGALKARNLEIFQDFLTDNSMGDQAHDFLMASGRLQTICYKYEIERLLRTPNIGGYQLLGLNDFPGQGTALVGAVNPFWETKAYTTPAEYTRFSGPSVPLARLSKFIFKADESISADLEISHYAAKPLISATPEWQLVDKRGKIQRSGKLATCDIPIGQSALGKIVVPLTGLNTPAQLKLVVSIANTSIRNDWDIWVYPATTPDTNSGDIVVSTDPTDAWKKMLGGNSVLLTPPADKIADPSGPKVVFGFSSIFWNTACTGRQPPTTMGILCDPKHPVFAEFPTDFHSNFQWWHLIRLAKKPLSLEEQNPKLRPLVQVIDDYYTARRLGLLVEAKCGKGKLLISAVDLARKDGDEAVVSQFRASLLNYMKSKAFTPNHELDEAAFSKFFQATP
jgi:Glycosyl hydrolases family 2, sugar binding domain